MTNEPRGRHQGKAVALHYDDPTELPIVAAGGVGDVARRIVDIAREHGIPVERHEQLAEMLAGAAWERQIPQESFVLVAEVISFLYHLDNEWRTRHSFLDTVLGDDPARST